MSQEQSIKQQLEAAQSQIQKLSQQLIAERDAAHQTQAQLQDQLEQQQRHMAQLEAQTNQLQRLINTSPATTYSCRPDGSYDCIFISQNIETTLGYTPEEVLAEPQFWAKRLHPDDVEGALVDMPLLFQRGSLSNEYRIRHRQGHYVWLRDERQLVYDSQGNLTEIVGYFVDISARKAAEGKKDEIAAQNRLQTEILQESYDSVITTDLDGLIVSWNPGAERMYGYSAAEVVGQSIALIYDNPAELGQQMIPTLLANGRYQTEAIRRHQAGHRVYIDLKLAIRHDERGNPYQILGIACDITARKQAEQALRHSEAKLHAILNNSPAKTFVEDLAGRYLFVNQTFLRIFNCQAEDVLGKTIDEFFPPDVVDTFRTNDQLLLERGDDVQQFEEMVRVDGEERIFLSNKFLLKNDQGQVYAICGMSTDITDFKENETCLKRQMAAIEAAIDGIAITKDNNFLYLNRAHLELFGYAHPEDLLGQPWTRLYSPAEQARLAQEVFPVLERSGSWSGEAIAIRQDGTSFDQGLSLTRLEDGLIICVCEDISESKAAERALQASQSLLQTVLETAPVAIFWKDLQGIYQGANPKTAEIFGLTSPADILHHSDDQLAWWADMVEIIRAEDRQILATGEPYLNIVQQVMTTTGHEVWLDLKKVALRDPQGHIVGVLGAAQDITTRKRAELKNQQLLNELAAFKTALDQSAIVAVTDAQGVILDVNDRFCEIAGYARRELIGQTHRLVNSGYHSADFFRHLWSTLSSGQVWRGEICNRAKDGTLYWVDSTLVPFLDERGQPECYLAIRFDISDRKRQAMALEAYACEVEDLYNNAPCGYHSLDAAGNITRINNTELRWLNYPREAVLGQPFTQFMAAASRLTFEERRAVLAQSGQVRTLEYEITLLGSDGGHLDVLVSEQVQKDAAGNILGSRATLVDIRQRLKTEKILQQQFLRENLLREMTQHIRQSLDVREMLVTVTRQVKQVLGCDRVIIFRLFADGRSCIEEEAVSPEFPALKGLVWEDENWSPEILEVYWQGKPRVVPDVMADRWTACPTDYSRQGQIKSKIVAPILSELFESETHRWVAPHQDNKLWGVLVVHACQQQRHWLQSEAQMLQQIANQLAIAIQQAGLFTQLQEELLERQQAQRDLTTSNRQLAILNEELARATRLKDEFLANMSHELRTPLNAILGLAEGMQEGVFGALTDRQRRSLNTIERSGTHLLSLINDILDVAKIEAGQLELNFTSVSVRLLCDFSLTFVRQQAHKKYLQIDTQIPVGLPDLQGDERRLRQVLINLLTNAVKFTPEGGRITITASYVSLTPESIASQRHCIHPQGDLAATVGLLSLAVADTGIGISPENAKKLFQPFVQVDSALNRQHQGTGLGLALVKRITEMHGGQVELTSQVGLGSCFTLRLPVLAIPSENSWAVDLTDSEDAAATLDPATAPLILLAEDNDANINTTTAYLTAKGYYLIVAKNGLEAVNLANTANPDLILMDIQMPQLDGLEAIRQIRQNPALANVPIVALTALAMADDQDRCLAAGADEYISKPVRLRHLSQVIQTLLVKPSTE